MESSAKLHIGPGKAYFPGWTNVDLFDHVEADMFAHALALPFEGGSFDLIYSSHVLEHLNRHMVSAALYHWRYLLKEGGILRLSVPNFRAVCRYYEKTGDLKSVMGLLYGGQKFVLDHHHVTFDFDSLYNLMSSVGLRDIQTWDWRETEHSLFDDYSQAYLPHMDKENGTLMSLNLEGIR